MALLQFVQQKNHRYTYKCGDMYQLYVLLSQMDRGTGRGNTVIKMTSEIL